MEPACGQSAARMKVQACRYQRQEGDEWQDGSLTASRYSASIVRIRDADGNVVNEPFKYYIISMGTILPLDPPEDEE